MEGIFTAEVEEQADICASEPQPHKQPLFTIKTQFERTKTLTTPTVFQNLIKSVSLVKSLSGKAFSCNHMRIFNST